jgi:hypothetical protein
MEECHKAMLRLMGKSVDETPKPRNGYGGAHAAMIEADRRQRDFDSGRSRSRHRRNYPSVSSRGKEALERIVKRTKVDEPIIQEMVVEEEQKVSNERTPGKYKLVSTDAMREFMTFVGLIEPCFPQLFARMNELQGQYPNRRGRKFDSVYDFAGAMLELHLRESVSWISQQEGFEYVSEHGLGDGEIREGYAIRYGRITGVHIYDSLRDRNGEIDCIRLVGGTPLGIETTISKGKAVGLRVRTTRKRKMLNGLYRNDCGIAVIVPRDVYRTQAEDIDVLTREERKSYCETSNLRDLKADGGIVVPFTFTRQEFQQAMLDFIPKKLDRPELIINYAA